MVNFGGLNCGLILTALLFMGVVILITFDIRLRKKINRELKAIFFKENTNQANLAAQILTLLLENNGKRSPLEISNYLDMPLDLVVQKLKEMERNGFVAKRELSEDYFICFDTCSKHFYIMGDNEKDRIS